MPENVALPSVLSAPDVTPPSSVIVREPPRSVVPMSVVWNSPTADPLELMTTPIPMVEPCRETPPNVAPLGKTPSAAAETCVSAAATVRSEGATLTASNATTTATAKPVTIFLIR